MPASLENASAVCGSGSTSSGGVFDVAGLRDQLEQLEVEMARPDLWDDPESAQVVGRNKNAVESELRLHDRLESGLDDAEVYRRVSEGLAAGAFRLDWALVPPMLSEADDG